MYTLYIKKFRHLRHLSQEELAFLSGISASYISRLESDNITRSRSPKLSVLLDISLALKICPRDILFYECINCVLSTECNKKQYLDEYDDDFYENNVIYYL
jgi:transcriptional regulator with XRE-family HTH domain